MKLKYSDDVALHWCPGCNELHMIPTAMDDAPRWNFNGNMERPTFAPSVRITGVKRIINGKEWTWEFDENGAPKQYVCHYFITDGKIIYCPDSTHSQSGMTIDLPEIPEAYL